MIPAPAVGSLVRQTQNPTEHVSADVAPELFALDEREARQ